MASGHQAPGHTPKWLRHQREVSEQAARREFKSGLNRIAIDVVQETQATRELFSQVTMTRAPMPSCGGWAMDASSMLALLHLVRKTRPRLIIECGSGSSTIWMAYLLEELGRGRIVSLEHDAQYAEHTRAQLSLHELERRGSIVDAPLIPLDNLPGAPVWYDLSNIPAGLPEIDLLLVDGPPAYVGKQARYPAVPVMESRLANSAAIVLDDTGRPDEQAVLERWIHEFSELTLAGVQAARAAFAVWNPQAVDQGPA